MESCRLHYFQNCDIIILNTSDLEKLKSYKSGALIGVVTNLLFFIDVLKLLKSLSTPCSIHIIDHFLHSCCYSITDEIIDSFIHNENITKVYVENYVGKNPSSKIHPMPIGLESKTINQIVTIKKTPFEMKPGGRVSATFHHLLHSRPNGGVTNSGFKPEREDAVKVLQGNDFVDFLPLMEKKEYFTHYQNYQFTISPLGNGVDCHRTWEALYFNTIPIVKTGPLDWLYEYYDLPVVIVKEWSEVTPANLEQWSLELSPKLPAVKLTIDYFINYPVKQVITPEHISFITLTNKGYLEYTKNCILSLKIFCKNTAKLECVCVDNESYNELSKLTECRLMDIENRDSRFLLCDGTNRDWTNMMGNKIKAIIDSLNRNEYVLYTDGDIVFQNPRFMDECFKYINEYDLVAQADDTWICCGFMLIKSNTATKKLFEYVYQEIIMNGQDDQPCMNSTFAKNLIKYKLLPRDLFPSGGYYMQYLPPKPYMIHFNCIIGHEKRSKMTEYGKWYNYGDFVFIPGFDQIGYDVGRTMDENEAINRVDCVGFNTLGFLKGQIEKLTPSPYFSLKDGIFIKINYFLTNEKSGPC